MACIKCYRGDYFVKSILEMSSEGSTKKRDSAVIEEAVSIDGPKLYRPDVDVSSIDERKLMRRIDWHVVPWLAVLYLLNFLDRGNIGNARVCALIV